MLNTKIADLCSFGNLRRIPDDQLRYLCKEINTEVIRREKEAIEKVAHLVIEWEKQNSESYQSQLG